MKHGQKITKQTHNCTNVHFHFMIHLFLLFFNTSSNVKKHYTFIKTSMTGLSSSSGDEDDEDGEFHGALPYHVKVCLSTCNSEAPSRSLRYLQPLCFPISFTLLLVHHLCSLSFSSSASFWTWTLLGLSRWCTRHGSGWPLVLWLCA